MHEQLISLMAENEEAISQLYRTYARTFPPYQVLWDELAQEEIQHAGWIRKLGLKAQEDLNLFITEKRFPAEAVKTFTRYVQREMERAKTGELTLKEALVATVYIEESAIEHKFFEIFESDSVELKHVLLNLYDATRKHRDKARAALAKLKQTEYQGF